MRIGENEAERDRLRMHRTKEGIPEEEYEFGLLQGGGGIRGERLGLRKDSRAVSQRGENLAQ
jgi:hypothetical protein